MQTRVKRGSLENLAEDVAEVAEMRRVAVEYGTDPDGNVRRDSRRKAKEEGHAPHPLLTIQRYRTSERNPKRNKGNAGSGMKLRLRS